MSDLTFLEKTKLERMFHMGGGYVLDFSNRTLAEFVAESVQKDIYDEKYSYASGSKAHRIRAFWTKEPNHLVGRLIDDMLEYCRPTEGVDEPDRVRLFEECKKIGTRLLRGTAIEALDAITPEGHDKGFEMLARAVRESLERNEPEAGLDRLHTYVTKLIRTLAQRRGIATDREKPLHSIFGEYVKAVRAAGLIQSEMSERILKSSISTMESFNKVRNDTSLAHDNPILSYEESILIYNHVCSSIRFIRALEDSVEENRSASADSTVVSAAKELDEDIPF